MNLTIKQKQILSAVVEGNSDGTPLDLDELIVRVPYITTKQSMQFSVRALMAKDLIKKEPTENRRGRSRRVFTVTPLGQHWYVALCPKPLSMNLSEIMDAKEIEIVEKSLEPI